MPQPRSKLLALVAAVLCAIIIGTVAFLCLSPASLTARPTTKTSAQLEAPAPQSRPIATSQEAADGSHGNPPAADGATQAGIWHDGAPEFQDGYVLADFAPNVSADEALAAFQADERLAGIALARETDSFVKLALPAGLGVKEAVELLGASDLVSAVQPNYTYYVFEEDAETATPATREATSASEAPSPTAGARALASASEASAGETQTTASGSEALAGVGAEGLLTGARLGGTLDAQSVPNDPRFDEQWGLTSANVPDAWDVVAERIAEGTGAAADDPIIVAVIDQGFNLSHPDLVNSVVDSYDAAAEQPGASSRIAGHGTHVAGIVAAETNNALGVAGATGNQCKVMLISLVDDDGLMNTDTLVTAYRHVLDYKAAGHDVRVVNVSLGDPRHNAEHDDADLELFNAIEEAHEAGVLTVAAACNTSGSEFSQAPFYAYPSDYHQVLSVINLQEYAGNDDGVVRAAGSNYNVAGQLDKDLSAPGTSILSTHVGRNYTRLSGTSMASPLVAGVAGLVFAAHPEMTPDEVASKLYSTARDLTRTQNAGPGWDRATGYGEVDAAAAVSSEGPYLTGGTLLATGEALDFAVKVDGAVQENWTWASSDPGVARVDSRGVVRGISQGQTIISATNGGVSAYQTLTVEGESAPIDIADEAISIIVADQRYTGERLLPIPEVYDGDARLRMNVHFTAEWADNLNAGTATVVVRGIGAYTGVATQTFSIEKAPLDSASLSVYPTTIQGDGTPKTPTVIVRDIGDNADKVLQQGIDYTLTSTNTVVGTGWVTLSATGACANFTGDVTFSYTVNAPYVPPYTPPYTPPSPPPDPPAQPDPPDSPEPPDPPQVVEVVDDATGVAAEGTVLGEPGVALEVTDVVADGNAGRTHAEALASKYADEISHRKVSGVFLVDLTRNGAAIDDVGELALEFPVKDVADGSPAKVIQLHDEGADQERKVIEHDDLVVDGGVVRVSLDGELSEFIVTVGYAGAPIYRVYNPNSGEHHYTLDAAERDFLVGAGWSDEGAGWFAPVGGTAAVYRVYNPNAGDHHYTLDAAERDFLVGAGWSDEGTGWISADAEDEPLYRLYNPNATGAGAHHYTKDAAERDFLAKIGWSDEGICWYGLP